MQRSGNPAFRKAFDRPIDISVSERMTLDGTINKTMLLFAILVICAAWTWNLYHSNPTATMAWLMVGLFGGLILGIITSFARTASPFTSPLYAACEGLLLGGISAVYQSEYGGIVLQAVMVTLCILAVMLFLYKDSHYQSYPKTLDRNHGGNWWSVSFIPGRYDHVHDGQADVIYVRREPSCHRHQSRHHRHCGFQPATRF